MRAVVGLVLALACAGCYARSSQGGGPTIQRTTQQPDVSTERAELNQLPHAQTR